MTSPAARRDDASYQPRCACGLVLLRSWDLIGHFLAVIPPRASRSMTSGTPT